jgi:Capsule assembly protein Wzi
MTGTMDRRTGRRAAAAALLMFLSGIGPIPLAAQTADSAGGRSASPAAPVPGEGRGWLGDAPASAALPADHWAVRAAARAEALGLADNYLPAQGAVPRAVVLRVLEHASAEAAGRPAFARLAAGWLARFREEFPEYGTDEDGDALFVPVNGRAAVGWADEEGRLSPAIGYFGAREHPERMPALSSPRVDVAAGTQNRRNLAAWALGRWDERGADVARWEAVGSIGPVALSAGRQPVSYGWGDGGGIVFGAPLMPRVEAQTLRPVRLPGLLRAFGGVTLNTFATHVGGRRHPDEPWLWGARLAFQPHRRLTFAVNRGSLFGGDEAAITPGRLAGMFLGVIRSRFENQVVSFEGRWRLPTDSILPATVYLEWGADDGAGALDEVPAQVGGIFFPALPGLPEVAAGIEGARFAGVCCGHGPWYFNSTHPGNWARGTWPLGHPLGGEGWEAAAYARAELMDARLRVNLRGYARDRSEESLGFYGGGNLYSPDRTGRSTGFRAEGAWRLAPRTELRALLAREAGDGWSERQAEGFLSVFF